jgi:hypothetical protein
VVKEPWSVSTLPSLALEMLSFLMISKRKAIFFSKMSNFKTQSSKEVQISNIKCFYKKILAEMCPVPPKRDRRGPCLPAGRKGRNMNEISSSGSPAVPAPSLTGWARSFTLNYFDIPLSFEL